MTAVLLGRNRPDPFWLNSVQLSLVASTLIAVEAGDRDLFAPHAYVPSQVCSAWSEALLAAVPDLVLVEAWDARRAQLRPTAVVRAQVSLQRGRPTRAGRRPDPWAGTPPLAERTAVGATPLGGLLLGLATWWGTCGGCSLTPGQRPPG